MQQHSQVVTVNPEIPADVIFIAFLEKDFAQQPSITLWQLVDQLAYFLLHLLSSQGSQKVDRLGRKILIFLTLSREIRLEVMFATAPPVNVTRALAMSSIGVKTGTPTALIDSAVSATSVRTRSMS